MTKIHYSDFATLWIVEGFGAADNGAPVHYRPQIPIYDWVGPSAREPNNSRARMGMPLEV